MRYIGVVLGLVRGNRNHSFLLERAEGLARFLAALQTAELTDEQLQAVRAPRSTGRIRS